MVNCESFCTYQFEVKCLLSRSKNKSLVQCSAVLLSLRFFLKRRDVIGPISFLCLQVFVCPFCWKPYKQKQDFVFHVKAVHGVAGGVKCPTCARTDFTNNNTFLRHRKICAQK